MYRALVFTAWGGYVRWVCAERMCVGMCAGMCAGYVRSACARVCAFGMCAGMCAGYVRRVRAPVWALFAFPQVMVPRGDLRTYPRTYCAHADCRPHIQRWHLALSRSSAHTPGHISWSEGTCSAHILCTYQLLGAHTRECTGVCAQSMCAGMCVGYVRGYVRGRPAVKMNNPPPL